MQTLENPPIPFFYPIPGGLQTGTEFILSGATYAGQQKQFEVNLKGDGDNVVLHVNPRFKFMEHTIVLNNRTYSGWQKEERHHNRFTLGDSFRLRIACHQSHFVIFVNDKELARFEHRLAPQMVRSLEVNGDVVLHRVNIVNLMNPPTQSYDQPPRQPYPPPPSFSQPSTTSPYYSPPPMGGPSEYPTMQPAPSLGFEQLPPNAPYPNAPYEQQDAPYPNAPYPQQQQDAPYPNAPHQYHPYR